MRIDRKAKNLGMYVENVGTTVRRAGALKGWRDLGMKAWERDEEARGDSTLSRRLGS